MANVFVAIVKGIFGLFKILAVMIGIAAILYVLGMFY